MPSNEQTSAKEHRTSPAASGNGFASPEMATLAILAFAVAVLYFGRDILIPVALATLLSFVLEPLATRLRRLGTPRTAAVVAVVALALVVMAVIGFLVGRSVLQLMENVPVYQQNIERKIASLRQGPPGGGVIEKASNAIQHIEKQISKPQDGSAAAQQAATGQEPVAVRVEPGPTPLRTLGDLTSPFLGPIGTAGLVVVFLIFMLLEQEEIRDRFIRLAGRREITVTTQAFGEAADRVSRYLRMQLLVNTSYGVPIGVGLYFIGVPNALLWGALAIVLRFIPYVGPFIAAAFPVALALAVDPGWSMVLWTLALFVVVELISNNAIEPWLYGHSTGLSTVAIILAAIFWTTLWGPVGLLLSTPLTVCLVVLGRHVPQLRFLEVLLGSAPALKPAERFYQRMLAGDTGEGEEIAAPYLAADDFAGFCYDVALPALRLAENDRRREALSGERLETVAANVQLVVDALPDGDDDEDAPEAEHDAHEEKAVKLLCVGGRSALDVAAAALLAQRLARADIEARMASWESLDEEGIGRLDSDGIEAIAIVHLGPSGVAHVRQTLRRLRRSSRVARLAVLLNGQLPSPVADEQVKSLNAQAVALTLDEAVQWLQDRFGKAEPTMMRAPIPAREKERLAELERLDILDTPREPAFDSITAQLRDALDVPIALVSLVDANRQFWKSSCGLPEGLEAAREAPRDTSICGHVVAGNEPLVVEDVLRDERFAGNPFLRQHGIRFYAGAPLRSQGLAVGSLCVLDTRPRRINAAERRLLSIIADQVVRQMESAAEGRTPRGQGDGAQPHCHRQPQKRDGAVGTPRGGASSELDRRPMPPFVARLGTRKRELGSAPSIARVTPRSSAPQVQQSLASRVKTEKAEDGFALGARRRGSAADQLVVGHAAIGKRHRAPCLDPNGGPEAKSRPEDDSVEQVSLQADVAGDRSIVVGARQRGNEIDVTGRTPFEEAAARHLDHHLDDGSRFDHSAIIGLANAFAGCSAAACVRRMASETPASRPSHRLAA